MNVWLLLIYDRDQVLAVLAENTRLSQLATVSPFTTTVTDGLLSGVATDDATSRFLR